MPTLQHGYNNTIMNQIRDIIIIRLDGLGDMILWLSSLQHIRQVYHNRHITVMIHEAWAPFLVNLNMADDVIPIPFISTMQSFKRKRFYHLRLLMLLLQVSCWARQWQAAMVIHPTHARTLISDLLATLIRSPIRWGVLGNQHNEWKKIQWVPGLRFKDMNKRYSHRVTGNPHMMVLPLNAHVTSTITAQPMPPSMINLCQRTTTSPLSPPYIVWCPQAGDSGREWPLEKWEIVLTDLPIPIVVVGIGQASLLLKKIIQRLSSNGQVLMDWVGQTTLSELAGVLSHASLFLGNDSGVTHLASALQIPSIMIIGGGHYSTYAPYVGVKGGPTVCKHELPCYGCNWTCHHKDYQSNHAYPCVEMVDPNWVRQQVYQHLPRTSN